MVRFLKHVQRHLGGKVLVIWDRLLAHQEQAVQRFVAEAGGGICIEPWPRYAPDLNPNEGVWNYLKQVELRNVTGHNLGKLRDQLRQALARWRDKADIIRSFFKQYGY